MIEFHVLGTPVVRLVGGGDSRSVRLQPKPTALLAYLVLAGAAGPCRRDTLLGLFWPDLDEEHARNALSQAIHRLRRTLGDGVIVSRGVEELCIAPESISCDALALERFALDGRFADALELYHGPLLEGVHVRASSLEYWLENERERVCRLACAAALSLADRDGAAGNSSGASHWLQKFLDLEPHDEVVLRRLMLTLGQIGDRTGAIRAYETSRRRLWEDLDLEPSAETEALVLRLRTKPDQSTLRFDGGPSVAVLPFANIDGDPDQEYFCDGITEEIIHALTQVRGLRVAARTSVFAVKHRLEDVRTLARQFGVTTLLEGSVRRVRDRVRITAQLISADTGYHLWSERYDRPLEDVFAIQDEISESIVTTLRRELLKSSDSPPRRTEQSEAHNLYLKGLFRRRQRSPDDLRAACRYFMKAVAIDPEYAQAHAALAYTYALAGWFIYDAIPPKEAYPQAKDAAVAAITLDESLVEAHVALGFTSWAYEWNWAEGEKALQRAVALDPSNHSALGQYSSYLVLRGRVDEALEFLYRVERLEPFWIGPKAYKGVWQLFARRYEVAIEWLQHAEELEPRLFVAPFFLGDAFRLTGRLEEADAAYARAMAVMGRQPLILGRLGALRAAQSRPDEARNIISELENMAQTRYLRAPILAEVYLALGDHDAALDWLNRACKEREPMLVLLKGYPAYDPVRSDLRYAALLSEIGLAD